MIRELSFTNLNSLEKLLLLFGNSICSSFYLLSAYIEKTNEKDFCCDRLLSSLQDQIDISYENIEVFKNLIDAIDKGEDLRI